MQAKAAKQGKAGQEGMRKPATGSEPSASWSQESEDQPSDSNEETQELQKRVAGGGESRTQCCSQARLLAWSRVALVRGVG